MTKEEVDKLLTEQEKEAGFKLVYLPATVYLMHEVFGILAGWPERVDIDDLARLIREVADRP